MKFLSAYCFFLFFFLVPLVFGQNEEEIQRLKKVIETTKNDSLKLRAFVDLDALIFTSDPDLDLILNKKIIKICELKLKEKLSKKSRSFYMKNYSASLNNIGLVHYDKSNMLKAITCFTKAYSIAKRHYFKILEANVLNNMGMVYRDINSTEKALEYYLKSSKIESNSFFTAPTYNNIGLCYSELNQLSTAKIYFEKSINFSKKGNDQLNIANSTCNIGEIYLKQKDLALSLSYFTEALSIYLKIGNKLGIAYSYQRIGQVYFTQNKLDQAEHYFLLSHQIAKANKFLNVEQRNTLYLYQLNKKKNKLSEALDYLEKNKQYVTRINDELTTNHVVKKQVEFENNQFKIVNEYKHQKEIELSNEKNKRQQIFIYLILIVLILIIIFFVLINKSLREVKKQNQIIESQKQIVETKNKEITDSITYAKRIQSAILPPNKLVKQYFMESFILYKPKDIVAGDFYWFEVIDDTIFFAAADCTGHGVPGAMVSVVCHNALNRSVKEFNLKKPGEILDKTREIVVAEFEKADEDVKDGMDISLAALKFSAIEKSEMEVQSEKEREGEVDSSLPLSALTLLWSGANNPIWILRDQEIIEYKGDKQPIGKFSEAKPFHTHEISLQRGDEIYVFTDGFQDQFGGEKYKKFKAAQFRNLLISFPFLSMQEKKVKIDEVFENWKGTSEQVDDVCLIGVRI